MKYLKKFENPDTAKYKVNKKDFFCKTEDKDSVAFVMDANDEHVLVDFGQGASTHYRMRDDYDTKGLQKPSYSSACKFSGRVWVKRKFISFWITPSDKDELLKCLQELSQELIDKGHIDEPIFNDGWYVENYNGFEGRNKWAIENDLGSIEGSIPLEDYTGGQELDEEKYILHTMTPEEKERYFKLHPEKRIKGWGADLKAKRNPIWWEQAKRTSENKLNENPDLVKALDYKGELYNIHFDQKDAVSFGYDKDTDSLLLAVFQTYDYENHYDLSECGRHDMIYPGRIWMDSQLISFWEYPEDYKTLRGILTDIENRLKKEYEIDIDIDDNWEIEIVVDDSGKPSMPKTKYWGYVDSYDKKKPERFLKSKIIKVGEYTGSAKRSAAELAMQHIKVGKGGSDVISGFGSRNKKNAREWRQALGESASAQFTYNKQLNPKVWSENLFNERIREKLLTIAFEFFNELGYETPISDIILTGSLANYNWNEYSDFDVHILIDFSKVNTNVELVKKAVDGQRFMWNLRHNVSIKGHDVELYIQDVNELHKPSGLFSLLHNKWLTIPKYNQPTIDEEEVNFKYLTYKSGVDKLEEISNREMSPESAAKNHLYASEMKTKIMKSRKVGLEKPEAEFSVENLVFKRMRNNGDFERLIDIIGKFYDKIYTQ